MVHTAIKPVALGRAARLPLFGLSFGVMISIIFLTVVLVCVVVGPLSLSGQARAMNLLHRNTAPFSLNGGWLLILGTDNLGRGVLSRLIVASRNTIIISGSAVILCAAIGAILGLIAGYASGFISTVIMRLTDALMSFPTLLLAVAILAVLKPSVANVIMVLAVARLPVFIRTIRAAVLEIKQRPYVMAAKAMGASIPRILFRHIFPAVAPVLLTLASLELAAIMLVESGLSFLGIGIQPPEITWGIMVSDGRNYIGSAWWISFWPGIVIMCVTMSLIVISNWLRLVTDPRQRWRLAQSKGEGR
jgi:peptide/nickel transport system permease protein